MSEDKCQRCGVSCHAGVYLPDGRQVVVEHLHCRYWSPEGCAVYARRFELAPWCLHSSAAGPRLALRVGCPYWPHNGGKVRLSPEEYDRVFPLVAAAIRSTANLALTLTWAKFRQDALRREG